MREAQSLRQQLNGKDRDLDRALAKLMNDAQINVIRTDKAVRDKIVRHTWQFQSDSTANKAKRVLERVLKTPISESQALQKTLNIIGQLAPKLFGGDQQSPEAAGGKRIDSEPGSVQSREPETWHGMRLVGRNQVEIASGSYREVFYLHDPEITGEMIPCTSSNVHSFGFQMNLRNPTKSMLLVRYLQGPAGSKSKGPMYGYADVHPRVFRQMTIANSKGIFVWDELRIRGSIAGSQYRYSLLSVVGDNVPRRATIENGIQMLRRRTKHALNGSRTVSSRLGDQSVGRYRPTSRRPNRGNPNRQRPNRG